MSFKTYEELISFPTFEERFEYLKLNGQVGLTNFGSHNYIIQNIRKSPEWKHLRNSIILRDDGCDLGVEDFPIMGRAIMHHINPLTLEQVLNFDPAIFDPNNLITVSHLTHNAIHYCNESILQESFTERSSGDTKVW